MRSQIAHRFIALAALAALGLAGLAACGDDDDGGGSATTTGAAATTTAGGGAGSALRITAKDFEFDPAAASAAAGTLSAEVANAGAITHNFSIEQLGVDQDLEVGKTATVALGDVAAGSYEYVCKFHPGSMKGTLTVS